MRLCIIAQIKVVSPTNHAYFNLHGNLDGAATVLEHIVWMPTALRFVAIDASEIPTGDLPSVSAYPAMDFAQAPKTFGRDLNDTVLPYPGYDNAFVVSTAAVEHVMAHRVSHLGSSSTDGRGGSESTMRSSSAKTAAVPALDAYSPLSGIGLAVSTDQPSLQVYTGNFLDGTIPRKASQGGPSEHYAQYGGFTCEAALLPGALNQPDFPSVVITPDVPYTQRTVHAFYDATARPVRV